MSKLCPKCQYFVGPPLLSSTALIHGIHQSCTGCCWHLLPLLHNDIMELLDVRQMVLLHLPLEDAPHVLNRVQVWRHTWPLHHLHLQQQGSCHVGGVFGVVMLENYFLKEDIIFCFRMSQYMLESMFPSMNRSSLGPAVVMQLQTMMLPPPCLTAGKAQLSWYSSPGRCHTCWTQSESNKFNLDSSDHRTWFQ